jgi:hypothetical protein
MTYDGQSYHTPAGSPSYDRHKDQEAGVPPRQQTKHQQKLGGWNTQKRGLVVNRQGLYKPGCPR